MLSCALSYKLLIQQIQHQFSNIYSSDPQSPDSGPDLDRTTTTLTSACLSQGSQHWDASSPCCALSATATDPDDIHLHIDAVSSAGFGDFHGGRWFSTKWATEIMQFLLAWNSLTISSCSWDLPSRHCFLDQYNITFPSFDLVTITILWPTPILWWPLKRIPSKFILAAWASLNS